MQLYLYDLETYRNCFLFAGKFEDSPQIDLFEISPRKNQVDALLAHLYQLRDQNIHMVGFNSLGFDYPIIHDLMTAPSFWRTPERAYLLAQQIIKGGEYGLERIPYKDRFIPQIDLVKINHFDNNARRTSLKSLQFAMRSESVEDLPFDPHTDLTSEQMDQLIAYNVHDLTETERFLKKCKHMIAARVEFLTNGVITGDVLNYSDVKIGAEYLVKRIGRQKCFNGSKPRQTYRSEVHLKTCVLPQTSFDTEECQAVLDWFKKQVIYTDGDERPKLETKIGDIDFHFGVGGVHASVNNKTYETNDEWVICDVDVAGMYVAVATANEFAPEHLGRDFVTAYAGLKTDRARYEKGSFMNLLLKLAGNGVFGNSNNPYSPFFDPKYLYTVTVNGQLQLMQLVERLLKIPMLQLIQANTDGITAYVHRSTLPFFKFWCDEWENVTKLKLEHVEYKKMWIRDVNNYVALKMDDTTKLKGAYWYPKTEKDYDGVWNKDFSFMAIQKAAELCLVHDLDPEHVINCVTDPFDFMGRYKTTGQAKVFIGDTLQPKTVRYFVSVNGEVMRKIEPPKGPLGTYKRRSGISDSFYQNVLREIPQGSWDERIHTKNKSVYEERNTSIHSGYLVTQCNRADHFNWSTLDRKFYVDETRKLLF